MVAGTPPTSLPTRKHYPTIATRSECAPRKFPKQSQLQISHCLLAKREREQAEESAAREHAMPLLRRLRLRQRHWQRLPFTGFSDSMDQFGKFALSVCFKILPRYVRLQKALVVKTARKTEKKI